MNKCATCNKNTINDAARFPSEGKWYCNLGCAPEKETLLTKDKIKQQVSVLRDFLAVKNIKLTQSSAYELIAKIHGYPSWNYLSTEI